jgi:flavin-dependent dehydrogenase
VVADRLVLLGDAAGYLDAITGEGLSLAFDCALRLAALLPDAIARGARAAHLLPYARAFRRRYRHYAWLTRALLAIARRPLLRRRVIALLGAHPSLFDAIVAWALPSPASTMRLQPCGDPAL